MKMPAPGPLLLSLAFCVISSSCDRSGVVKPDQSESRAPAKATEAGSPGSLAGTACTTVSECGPGLDCDLSKGPAKGVCVNRTGPGNTPQAAEKP